MYKKTKFKLNLAKLILSGRLPGYLETSESGLRVTSIKIPDDLSSPMTVYFKGNMYGYFNIEGENTSFQKLKLQIITDEQYIYQDGDFITDGKIFLLYKESYQQTSFYYGIVDGVLRFDLHDSLARSAASFRKCSEVELNFCSLILSQNNIEWDNRTKVKPSTGCEPSSFAVDHLSLEAGLYLREVKELDNEVKLHVWDLRFTAPANKDYISPGALHVIEHCFAYELRKLLKEDYVSVFPFGCQTGFGLITTDKVDIKLLKSMLLEAICRIGYLKDKESVPALNAKQCGNPDLFDLKEANFRLNNYKNTLENP